MLLQMYAEAIPYLFPAAHGLPPHCSSIQSLPQDRRCVPPAQFWLPPCFGLQNSLPARLFSPLFLPLCCVLPPPKADYCQSLSPVFPIQPAHGVSRSIQRHPNDSDFENRHPPSEQQDGCAHKRYTRLRYISATLHPEYSIQNLPVEGFLL